MELLNGKQITVNKVYPKANTTKRDEVLNNWNSMARRAQVLDPSNRDAEAAKAAASRKHQKICKVLERYEELSVEELAVANEYMNGVSVRRISKAMNISRPRVEKGLDKAAEVLNRLMNSFEEI